MEENRKIKGKIVVFLGFVLIFICVSICVQISNDAIFVRADIAQEKISKFSLSNTDPEVDTTELDSMELKMNICKAGMVMGGIVIAIGIFWCAVPTKKKIVHTASHNNYQVQNKEIIRQQSVQIKNTDIMRELKEMLDSKLITEEEYESKKDEILKRM